MYRAVHEDGQILDVTTDKSPVLALVIRDLVPDAEHCTEQYANNRIEADHGRLEAAFNELLPTLRALPCARRRVRARQG